MMDMLLIFLWAALEVGLAHLFLAAFLPAKHPSVWALVAAWIANALFGLLDLPGIYRYAMYLLTVVAFLLGIYEESGGKGLCLLLFALVIPVTVDGAMAQLAPDAPEIAITAGKILVLAVAYALLKYRRSKEKDAIPADSEALLLRQHMELQQESMNALEQSYRLQRKSAHEFEHHLQVLRDLLDRNETDTAREYLARLKKNRSIQVMHVSSKHPVVDVILNQKYHTARQSEINMQIQVNDLSGMGIPSDAMAVILTNLLDNAIEACRRVDGCRELFCTVLWDEGLTISIRNTSLPVNIVDGKIPTSKVDSLSHGFGLLSVSHVLDGLGAEYSFGYEDGWFCFTAEME